jgi:hypothetical protein
MSTPTATASRTSNVVSGLDLDENDESQMANSSAKVTTKLSEDGVSFPERKSAVVEVAQNVHEVLKEPKPKTVADIVCMALIARNIPKDIRSEARGHASAFEAFNWVASL